MKSKGKNDLVRGILVLWIVSWLALIASLLLVWPTAPISRVLIEKLAIAGFGVLVGVMAVRGKLRWQPWVCAPAVLYLALHILLASVVWLSDAEPSEGFWANLIGHIAVRPYIAYWLLIHHEFVKAVGFTIEQILVPALQVVILLLAVFWWRLPPSNSAPHADGRQAPRLDHPSSAPAGGRER